MSAPIIANHVMERCGAFRSWPISKRYPNLCATPGDEPFRWMKTLGFVLLGRHACVHPMLGFVQGQAQACAAFPHLCRSEDVDRQFEEWAARREHKQ